MKLNFYHLVGIMLIFSNISCNEKIKKASNEIMNQQQNKNKWQQYRGVNVDCSIKEKDILFLSKTGANLIRLTMPICTFIDLEPPYNYNEVAFAKLDSVLNWGEKYGISVLIDPHRYPGTEHKWKCNSWL
jgi:aryl-phospho-beta-D-glucosidase BglC (GH1 family)